jgi:hypothetical protein
MMCRGKRIWLVETARRYVDGFRCAGTAVRKGSPAGTTKSARHEWRRLEADRITLHEVEASNGKGDPSNDRRTGCALAGLAVADHPVRWVTSRAIAHLTAETPAFKNRGTSHFVPRFPRDAAQRIGVQLQQTALTASAEAQRPDARVLQRKLATHSSLSAASPCSAAAGWRCAILS